MKQFKWILGLLLISMLAIACSPTEDESAAEAPAEEVVQQEAVEEETMAEEATMDDEEMMEEEMDEEMAAEGETTYIVNAADSNVVWTGAKAVGDSHTGTVNISQGNLIIDEGTLVSGSIVLDMTSIANTDLSGGMKDRLEGHLKSDEFFGVEQHPEATLAINSVEPNGDNTYNVVADLTIKGITNPVEFVATASEENDMLTATADIVFDRALYDVQYGSGTFFTGLGDDLINDEVEISVDLVASNS